MKKLHSLLIVCALAHSAAVAADPPHDALETLRFPPDLVIDRADELGLSSEQRESVKALLQKVQEQFTDLQRELRAEMEKLQPLLREARVDESVARRQFEAMLQKENAVKTLQFSLLVQTRNILEPDQWAKLRSLQEKLTRRSRSQPADEQRRRMQGAMRELEEKIQRAKAEGRSDEAVADAMQRLRELRERMRQGGAPEADRPQESSEVAQGEAFRKKMQRVQEGVERWQTEGRDPEPIRDQMERFEDLMKAGRPQDAQKHLDRALDLLAKPRE